MKPIEALKVLKDMEVRLQQLSDDYSAGKETGVTDAEYDRMFADAKALADDLRVAISPNSILAKVGDDRVSGFARITHKTPMLSIEDVFEHDSEDIQERYSEVVEWYRKVCETLGEPNGADLTLESKIDGCAASVVYENGKLKYVATRGNGTVGDDITANVRGISGIPEDLNEPGLSFETRGEIVMLNSDFEELNASRIEAGLRTFANPRNTVAGTIKSKDPEEIKGRKMYFIPHTDTDTSGAYMAAARLTAMRVPCEYLDYKNMVHPDLLAERIHALRGVLTSTPFNTDGLVIKLSNSWSREKLGYTSRAPRWACALKFLPEQKKATLLGIDFQVGRTGVVTPVAKMTPTYVSGSTVSSATLHNQDQISRLGVNIGDEVLIEKSGEIIPAVVRVEKKGPNEGALDIMTHLGGKCPVCGAALTKEGVAIVCPNPECNGRTLASINYFFSKSGLRVLGLGESFLKALMECCGVENPLDVFRLSEDAIAAAKTDDGNGVSKAIGKLAAHKIKIQLNVARKEPLAKWLTAFGVSLIGQVTAKKLTKKYRTFRDLLSGTEDDFSPIIGPAAAASLAEMCPVLYELLDSADLLDVITSDNWIDPAASTDGPGKLDGIRICVTGKLSRERSYFQETIEKHGGTFQSGVTGTTTYLLAGEGGGGKRKKAESLGVEIIDETKFWELCR